MKQNLSQHTINKSIVKNQNTLMSFAKLYGNIFKQIDKTIDKEVVKKS
jgi:hypothetical protein